MMEYVAYGFIILALLIELRDSIKGVKDSIDKEVKFRMISTSLFLAGTITYVFTGHFLLLLVLFVGMTVVSSWMLGLSTAIFIEADYEGISREIKKKREKNNKR